MYMWASTTPFSAETCASKITLPYKTQHRQQNQQPLTSWHCRKALFLLDSVEVTLAFWLKEGTVSHAKLAAAWNLFLNPSSFKIMMEREEKRKETCLLYFWNANTRASVSTGNPLTALANMLQVLQIMQASFWNARNTSESIRLSFLASFQILPGKAQGQSRQIKT